MNLEKIRFFLTDGLLTKIDFNDFNLKKNIITKKDIIANLYDLNDQIINLESKKYFLVKTDHDNGYDFADKLIWTYNKQIIEKNMVRRTSDTIIIYDQLLNSLENKISYLKDIEKVRNESCLSVPKLLVYVGEYPTDKQQFLLDYQSY
jgi:hypothetical protein